MVKNEGSTHKFGHMNECALGQVHLKVWVFKRARNNTAMIIFFLKNLIMFSVFLISCDLPHFLVQKLSIMITIP